MMGYVSIQMEITPYKQNWPKNNKKIPENHKKGINFKIENFNSVKIAGNMKEYLNLIIIQ